MNAEKAMKELSTAAPVFVVGCPRSGTTLCRNLLKSHPHMAIPTESHFIPQYYLAYGDPRTSRQARNLARRILRLRMVQSWGISLSPEEFVDCRHYGQLIQRMFTAYAVSRGKPRWGDKTPQNVMYLDILWRLFPNLKILHVIRDGRDVALSWQSLLFGPGNTYTAAQLWKRLVMDGRSAGNRLGEDRYTEIRYEDLVTKTEEATREICSFLGEPWTPKMLTPTPTSARPRKPLIGSRRAGHVRVPEVVGSSIQRWKSQMDPGQSAVFEAVAGDALETLGYPVQRPTCVIGDRQRLGWMMQNRLRWIMDRLVADQKRYWLGTEIRLVATRVRAQAKRRMMK